MPSTAHQSKAADLCRAVVRVQWAILRFGYRDTRHGEEADKQSGEAAEL
jgi:hypothetical protein